MTNAQPRRPIRKLLVANRGEIATRIINAAREHDPPIEVYGISSPGDDAHTLSLDPDCILKLPSAGDHMNGPLLIQLARKFQIDAIHPGYGFLSESAEFAQRALDEAGAVVIGPGPGILAQTGDKLSARHLAVQCEVPVLPAVTQPVNEVQELHVFVEKHGLPVMLKAVDGGGGRGVRLVKDPNQLEGLFHRATAESPSRQVFVEKAALDGFHHIEVQIVGDGTGAVAHLWERDCSIQRKFQKVVEFCSSPLRWHDHTHELMQNIIAAGLRMAEHVKYMSLGTFEFLANPTTHEYFFLEVNPRLQVEHCVTEMVTLTDLVDVQLRLAQGASLADCLGKRTLMSPRTTLAEIPAPEYTGTYALQLRLTAEAPRQSFSLSVGKIKSFSLPNGLGIRVDTSLVAGHDCFVTSDFDSLLAKIIVSGNTWWTTVCRARRALEDTKVDGVQNNLDILRAIVASDDFRHGQCDTQWLEKNVDALVVSGEMISKSLAKRQFLRLPASTSESGLSGMSSSTVLLRKGDAWQVELKPVNGSMEGEQQHLLKLSRVLRNEFPASLSAEIEHFMSGDKQPQRYRLTATITSASSLTSSNASARKGDPKNPGHVVLPFPGKLVEILVDEGDFVQPGQVICVIKQMKMELEIRARDQQQGTVKWVTEAEDGADLGGGMLIAELDSNMDSQFSAKL